MKRLTPYEELDNVLRKHANRLREALGRRFTGMYLQGSLAIGDFDLTSDVDFIVVTEGGDLKTQEVEAVQAVHTRTYNEKDRWVKRLEYSFFPKATLQSSSSPYDTKGRVESPERELWYFDNGHQKIERSDHCNTLVTRWTVREKGITVLGPEPSTLVEAIRADDLTVEIKNTAVGWGIELLQNPIPYRNRFYQSYLVLNYCRMLHDLYAGSINSKWVGVRWAKEELDSSWESLIDFCWTERQDTSISVRQPSDAAIFPKSIEFVEYAVSLAEKYKV